MINDNHDPDEVKKILSSSARSAWIRAEELIHEKASIKTGMTCVDIGCGAGIISIPVSMIVGDGGRVYAIDMKKELLDHIVAQNPSSSLITVNRDAADTGLDMDIADVCFMVLILHEVPVEKALAEAYRIIKPGGKAVILEWREERTKAGPPVSERIGSDRMRELCKQAGFSSFDIDPEWTDDHYVITAVK